MIALLSDIHGNLPALKAVLDLAISLGCNRFISLGDIVGYYAQPGECIDLLREHNAVNIMGNHDNYMITGIDCPRSKKVMEMMNYQSTVVNADQIVWLSKSHLTIIEGSMYLVHGGWEDPLDQYLYAVSLKDIPPEAEILFTGHTHVQGIIEFGRQKYCNPGSVGQPRDGDPRAAFAVLSDGNIHLHRVEYDIDETAFMMRRAGFPKLYYENLYNGAQIGGRTDKLNKISPL